MHRYKHRLGRKHALLVASGTSALSVAMMAADVGPGDEVLVPGYMWVVRHASYAPHARSPSLLAADTSRNAVVH